MKANAHSAMEEINAIPRIGCEKTAALVTFEEVYMCWRSLVWRGTTFHPCTYNIYCPQIQAQYISSSPIHCLQTIRLLGTHAQSGFDSNSHIRTKKICGTQQTFYQMHIHQEIRDRKTSTITLTFSLLHTHMGQNGIEYGNINKRSQGRAAVTNLHPLTF
jgi:hypothetical protein